jgi:hypothetical protein
METRTLSKAAKLAPDFENTEQCCTAQERRAGMQKCADGVLHSRNNRNMIAENSFAGEAASRAAGETRQD